MRNEMTMHHHDRKTTGQRTEMNVETGGMAQTGNINYKALATFPVGTVEKKAAKVTTAVCEQVIVTNSLCAYWAGEMFFKALIPIRDG